MKSRFIPPLSILTTLLLCSAPLAAQQRLLITVAPQQAEQLQRVQRASTGQPAGWQRFSQLPDIMVAELAQGADLRQEMQRLRQLPGVLTVEPDFRLRKIATPNDPQLSQQWHLNGSFGINGAAAWDLSTGDSEQVIAVIDTGVDYNHADLAANIWQNPQEIAGDAIDNDNNGYVDDIYGINPADDNSDPMDEDGHGTQVASIMAAVTDNAVGIAGVSWQTKILPCRFMDKNGEGFVSDAIACLNYVLDLKNNQGVNIIATNNSWGSSSFSQALYNAIVAQRDAGILFIAGAGNDGNSARFYPAGYNLSNIISVAAHDQQGALAGFSNYGRDWVHLSAPGVAIAAAQTGGGYATASGTSMAAPVVSGVAALVAAYEPALGMTALRNRILIAGAPADDSTIATQTMAGQRLLAAGGDTQGALGCNGGTLQRRITPLTDVLYLEAGDTVDIQVLSLSCFGDSLPASVSAGPMQQAVAVNDDGQQQDQQAADGIYSGRFQFDGNATTLNYPDGQVQLRLRNNNFCAVNAVTEIPLAECDALVELYYDTLGQHWLNNENWLLTATPCSWFGVTCNNGQVSEINLLSNNLNGQLPAALNQLSALAVFDVSDNNLHGSFPAALLQLTQLQRLVLWQNAFSGVLPPALGNLTSLQLLDLSENRFSAALPSGLGNLSNLQQLYLEDNLFEGAVPQTFGQLAQLQVLWLFDNNLTGTLPQSLTGLSQMQDFRFNDTSVCAPANQAFGNWLAGLTTLHINTSCANTPPTVAAGSNQTVNSGTVVQLQASASDAEFNALSYQWQQIAGTTVALSSQDELNPRFTAPAVSSNTVLRFRFTANDGISSSSAEVEITVQPLANSGGPGNNAGGESGGGAIGIVAMCALLLLWTRRLGKRM
ncbi:MAG: S8 family serine peptidase [Gammaproteobacteria bacterium]|nr:S8 family serine peptidase [Gammaproteobacteria bacterium]MBU2184501.1 S8 family serine peptidase [Gammaproteobacteria bacterium]MBU2205183.1 S8 family serine peptidase [Gammaproteobacteria bacterium]